MYGTLPNPRLHRGKPGVSKRPKLQGINQKNTGVHPSDSITSQIVQERIRSLHTIHLVAPQHWDILSKKWFLAAPSLLRARGEVLAGCRKHSRFPSRLGLRLPRTSHPRLAARPGSPCPAGAAKCRKHRARSQRKGILRVDENLTWKGSRHTAEHCRPTVYRLQLPPAARQHRVGTALGAGRRQEIRHLRRRGISHLSWGGENK